MATETDPLAHEELDLLAALYPLPRLALAAGRGARVTDRAGRTYLDFTCGIAVNAFGHAPRGLASVVARQMRTLGHVSNLFAHEPGMALARALTQATGYERVFYANSGTEGIEAALKFARARARALDRPGRTLVSFTGGFHGRTGFALSATWNPEYRAPFEPLIPGVRFLPFGDVAALAEGIDADTCGVIVEPIQGESGAVVAPAGFLAALRKRCDEVGALLILDEVQSGVGRTGHFLAATHTGVKADITVLSKALGGGLPLAAVLLTAEAAQPLAAGMHGTTFGGNPVATAAGLWIVERVNRPAFLARVRKRGGRLLSRLHALVAAQPGVLSEARGLGLLTGVEIAAGAPFGPKELVAAAREQGLLLVRGGDRAVRVLPPLDVDDRTIDEGVDLLERAVKALLPAPQEATS
ncbi:MAG: aspartate aminotransferase family protein [Candidatus Eisenbacteria bacterium]